MSTQAGFYLLPTGPPTQNPIIPHTLLYPNNMLSQLYVLTLKDRKSSKQVFRFYCDQKLFIVHSSVCVTSMLKRLSDSFPVIRLACRTRDLSLIRISLPNSALSRLRRSCHGVVVVSVGIKIACWLRISS